MNLIARSIAQIGVGYSQQHVARVGLFGQEESPGRSGYWRLFFYQLQEEALKKKPLEDNKKAIKLEPVVELKDGSAIVGAPKAKLQASVDSFEPIEPNLFKPTKLTSEPLPYIIETMRVRFELGQLFTSWKIRGILSTPSNTLDKCDEEDVELLLLLAA